MTKASMFGDSFGNDITETYKNALIWDTGLTQNATDHRENEGKSLNDSNKASFSKVVDEFRRRVKENSMEKANEDYSSENVDRVWQDFSRETSFHGVRHIKSVSRDRKSRVFWLVLVLAMAGGLLYTVISLLLDYYQYNTVTKTEIKVASSFPFPSLTLCNICPYKNIDKRLDTAVAKIAASGTMFSEQFPLNSSDPDMIAFMSQNMTDIQDIYSYHATEMFLQGTYENTPINITEAFDIQETQIGRCFVFNGPKYVAKHGVRQATYSGRYSGLHVTVNLHQEYYFLYDDMTAGLRLFVSDNPETPRLTTDGIDIHPGTSSRVALSPILYKFKPAPYQSFGSEKCLETKGEELIDKMYDAPFYSRTLCVDQCIELVASQECGCYTHLLKVRGLRECTAFEAFNCLTEARFKVNKSSCDCPRLCEFTRYDVTMSASQLPSRVSSAYIMKFVNESSPAHLRENYLDLRVYLDSMLIRYERHEPQFTFNSMFAFLGGQMGFFMGASLITMAELAETLARSVYVFFTKKLLKLGQMQPEKQKRLELSRRKIRPLDAWR